MIKEIKPTWKIAAQVSWLHTTWSNQITGTLILLFLIFSSIFLIATGHHLTFSLLVEFLAKYKWIIIPVILLVHFIPVNWYAITKVLQHRYPSFRIMVIQEEEQKQEKNSQNQKT